MPDDLDRALLFFDIPEVDLAPLRYAAEQARTDPALGQWVADAGATLRAAMGTPSPPPLLPARPVGPAHSPEVTAYLPVVALARVLPETQSWATERGIAPVVVAATMRDVGRMLRRNRVWFGQPGLGDELAGWLTRHVTGAIYEVGRLQFERVGLGVRTSAWLRSDGVGAGPGDLAISLHIPETGSGLKPAAVAESLRAGRSLLRKRFPDERYAATVCFSWLLDPQLADWLPDESNIVAFQRRFVIGSARDDDGDASVRKFVFGNSSEPAAALPTRTALERAAVGLWQAGGHWRVHTGRIP